jgi:hypothetical protein
LCRHHHNRGSEREKQYKHSSLFSTGEGLHKTQDFLFYLLVLFKEEEEEKSRVQINTTMEGDVSSVERPPGFKSFVINSMSSEKEHDNPLAAIIYAVLLLSGNLFFHFFFFF